MPYTYGTDEWEMAYLELTEKRGQEQSTPYMLATPEWISVLEKNVQNDEAYKEAGKTWEGSITIHFKANPEVGIDRDVHLLMDLWHGDCRSMRLVPPKVGQAGAYVITGEYDKWKGVMNGEIDTVKGMMQGKLKLKGDMATVVRQVAAAKRMVELVGTVDTKFPDEMSAEECEEYRGLFNVLNEEFGI